MHKAENPPVTQQFLCTSMYESNRNKSKTSPTKKLPQEHRGLPNIKYMLSLITKVRLTLEHQNQEVPICQRSHDVVRVGIISPTLCVLRLDVGGIVHLSLLQNSPRRLPGST